MRHIKEDPLQIKFKEMLWNCNIDSVLCLLCFMHIIEQFVFTIEQVVCPTLGKKNRSLFRVLIF